MINEKILCLVHTGCGDLKLKKHEQKLDAMVRWDPDVRLVEPLKKIFSKVIRYDFGKNYSEHGVLSTNNEIINIVSKERPKYLLWTSMSYEILEKTFQLIREKSTIVIGWFFDDECRFDDYSKWLIPYLDYVLTTDKASVDKYKLLGVPAMHLLVTSNPYVFRKMEIEKKYDASFVGSAITDRKEWIDRIQSNGIKVSVFGSGWNNGYISLDEMKNIYNATKINLCFVKSYGTITRPQIKNKIFDICMCSGFLLCEYVSGIEEFFEIDKEIICFKNVEEAINKIHYYLVHEEEREKIAQMGFKRAQREHDQFLWLSKTFEEIDKNVKTNINRMFQPKEFVMPKQIRILPSSYHLRWAKVLMLEGFPKRRWQEEIDLSLFYDHRNIRAYLLKLMGYLPSVLLFMIK